MSRERLRLADYLAHVVEAIERIERNTSGLAYDAFSSNEMAQDAVIRNLEILGEACRNIDRSFPGFAATYPRFRLRDAQLARARLFRGRLGRGLANDPGGSAAAAPAGGGGDTRCGLRLTCVARMRRRCADRGE
jgi:uncharacterized protein with HEPN domain